MTAAALAHDIVFAAPPLTFNRRAAPRTPGASRQAPMRADDLTTLVCMKQPSYLFDRRAHRTGRHDNCIIPEIDPMEQLRPHDGQRKQIAPIRLNVHNFQPGEQVLYEGFGGWSAGVITQINGNNAEINREHLQITRIKARVPAGADADAIVRGLKDAAERQTLAVGAARRQYDADVEETLASHGVGHPAEVEG